MTRRLLASYLTLTLFVLLVLEIPLGVSNARSQRQDLTTKVERDAVALATLSEDALEGSRGRSPRTLQAIAGRYTRETGGRVLIVDAGASSLVDSAGTPGRSFASRPEIHTALAGDVATGTRHSDTLGTDLLYVAVPVASSGVVHGAVRITYPLSAVEARILRYWLILAAVGAVVLAVAMAIALRFARSITRPLANVERAVAAAGHGQLDARAPESDGPPEVRELAASFNETVRRLDALVRSRDAFVADASHQLRTPLAALRLRLETLEGDLSGESRDDLGAALAEVARLSHLVDGLLTLARSDETTSAPERVPLDRAVAERIDAWSALAAEQDVALVAAVEPGLAGRATAGRIEQVLDNLLANALEVSPRGGAIRVTGARAGGWAELHVVDEGPGMTPEQRSRAFDRFWRGGPGGGGSGLGLAIVERLVTSDGGQVELAEAPGGGLDAVVRLRAVG